MSNKLKKRIGQILLFFLVMGFTLFTVFKGQDFHEIWNALKSLSPFALIAALIFSFLYVACEGFMIWFMFASHNGIRGLLQCIGYAFIGFFYSGITPSASGGQPMQLYYIKKDGYSFSKSCATLTAIAAMNKFVLASVGVVLLVFFNDVIHEVFYGHMGWYYLGLIIVVFWVVLLLFIMINPDLIEKIREFCKYYKVKSRNIAMGKCNLVVEVRSGKEYDMVQAIEGMKGVENVSLIAHDGEVTF